MNNRKKHVRHWIDGSKHSDEAKDMVEDFVKLLKQIPDLCEGCFPFEEIGFMKRKYL